MTDHQKIHDIGTRLTYKKVHNMNKNEVWHAVLDVMDKWTKTGHILLHAGEMTAQELRTTKAVVSAIRAEVQQMFMDDRP